MSYEPRLHVVLFQPEIPPNTGNIGRSCVALQAKLWLIRPLGFLIDEKQVRRAGLDYWEHLQLQVVDDWREVADALAGHRFWFLSKNAKRPYYEPAFEQGDVFVFGSESSGLPAWLLDPNSDQALRIPIRPPVRSINLACSVAVTIFEAERQWTIREQASR